MAFGAALSLVLEAGATLLVTLASLNAFGPPWSQALTISVGWLADQRLCRPLRSRHGFADPGCWIRDQSTITAHLRELSPSSSLRSKPQVMVMLDLVFDILPSWGYLICAFAVVPLRPMGRPPTVCTWITQPICCVLLVLPLCSCFMPTRASCRSYRVMPGRADWGPVRRIGFGLGLDAVGTALDHANGRAG